jgi:hypothetical protein
MYTYKYIYIYIYIYICFFFRMLHYVWVYTYTIQVRYKRWLARNEGATRHCVPAAARIGHFFIYYYHYYYYHPIKVESLNLAILLSGYFRNVPYNRCGRPTTPREVAWAEHAALCSIISRSLFHRGERRRRECTKAARVARALELKLLSLTSREPTGRVSQLGPIFRIPIWSRMPCVL